MPFLYAQTEEKSPQGAVLHHVVDIPSLDQLVAFCTDDRVCAKMLQHENVKLVTFSPIYDVAVSNGMFCDSVEFLDDSIYFGELTPGMAEWLSSVSEKTLSLKEGRFGRGIPDCIINAIEGESDAILSKLKEGVDELCRFRDETEKEGYGPGTIGLPVYLFRSIFLNAPRFPGRIGEEVYLYGTLEAHAGETPVPARDYAIRSGVLDAELDHVYLCPDSQAFFIGIESFVRLPDATAFPMVIAHQQRRWPWEYDETDYKKALLTDILRINRKRKAENIPPFWE